MKNWWLKFGCFLIGYNFNIVANSTEIAAMKVKQTVSALLIVCVIWSFVGYTFSERYLKLGLIGSLIGAFLACVIIIQIERQIILTVHRNRWLYSMRIIIACMMAIIGSVIIDQVIFKEDIEKRKISLLNEEVKAVYPVKSEELRTQTKSLDSTLSAKEISRDILSNDISRNPTIKIYSGHTSSVPVATTTTDSTKKTSTKTVLVKTTTSTVNSIENPKIGMLASLDKQIEEIRALKMKKDNDLLTLRTSIEDDLKSKVGFLDELKVMFSLIMESSVALYVWILWFLILTGLELFILASKWGEKSNVYDETLMHQERLFKRKLDLLVEK